MDIEQMTGERDAELTPRRRGYEPPRAEFVPLQIEERLMACNKMEVMSVCVNLFPPASMS